MSPPDSEGGASTGRPALRRLVGDPDTFAATLWSRSPLLRHTGDASDLFSAAAVDELLAERGVRTPFVRVARNGQTLADRGFTAPGGVGAMVADQIADDQLLHHFAGGSTIVLQGLHRLWPPLIGFAQQLAADLGHPVQVNSYVTPPESQGFADHYDVHDVFVVQIGGEKRWRVRAPVVDSPGRDQPWTERADLVAQAAGQDPLIETVLRPGDCLYLPRGYLHSAVALGGTSIHLTIGVHPWTMQHLLERVAQQALADLGSQDRFRASLPVGVDLAAPAGTGDQDLQAALQQARTALADAVEKVLVDDVRPSLARAARDAQRAEPIRVLAQHEAARQLRTDDLLRARRHLAARWESADQGVRLRSRAGVLLLSTSEAEAAGVLLERGSAAAGDLGLDLARRLLLAGIAVIDPG